MKIVFISNYYNHHQKPFCEEIYKRIGTNFSFVSTTMMHAERKKLGYSQETVPDYVVCAYLNEKQRKEAIKKINDADVVIWGSAPYKFIFKRNLFRKLTFKYSERLFKKETSLFKKIYHSMVLKMQNLHNRNVYLLCASAYAYEDYRSIGLYKNRGYRWGYFPETKEYDTESLMKNKKHNVLLWCGRFLDWKHPDDAIKVAVKLKEAGYDFQMNFIGTGKMEGVLHQLVDELNLSDRVQFLGSMPPEQVRKHMEEAGIYLFTSDRQEGWGAVLNESMNSGCAVVASHAIGSVHYLVKDNDNGLVYTSGDVNMLFEKVKCLLDNPEEQRRLGMSAYETLTETWNAEVAAERLIHLSERIIAGEKHPELYEYGPCSKAEIIKDNWLKLDENKT